MVGEPAQNSDCSCGWWKSSVQIFLCRKFFREHLVHSGKQADWSVVFFMSDAFPFFRIKTIRSSFMLLGPGNDADMC